MPYSLICKNPSIRQVFELNTWNIIVIAYVRVMVPAIGVYISTVFPSASSASELEMDKEFVVVMFTFTLNVFVQKMWRWHFFDAVNGEGRDRGAVVLVCCPLLSWTHIRLNIDQWNPPWLAFTGCCIDILSPTTVNSHQAENWPHLACINEQFQSPIATTCYKISYSLCLYMTHYSSLPSCQLVQLTHLFA